MAEAHAAVAFQFSVTHRGVNVTVNRDALRKVLREFTTRSVRRLKHSVLNKIYPIPPTVCTLILAIIVGLHPFYGDWSGCVGCFEYFFALFLRESLAHSAAVILFGVAVLCSLIATLKYTLMCLLLYHGWMYEPVGRPSKITKLWFATVKLFVGKDPKLYSLQGALPPLPLPAVNDTVSRYLVSVEPWMSEEQYSRIKTLAEQFKAGPARKLQFYLFLKWLFTSNYVSDWWETYVYLHGRSPIMVNSNWYGVDLVLRDPPTNRPAARAAMMTYCFARVNRNVRDGNQKPILVQNTVPLCSWQYERLLNTVRVPGEEKDVLLHQEESDHVTVYCRGRIYVVQIADGDRLYSPAELERAFQAVLDADPEDVTDAERRLPALTAGERTPWAIARSRFFSNGVNRASLDMIESSMIFVVFDDCEYVYDPQDDSKLSNYAKAMLHGDCHSRWFDMAFTLIVGSNARCGCNAEHSYADGPAARHNWENAMLMEANIGYLSDGHCAETGEEKEKHGPSPVRLKWELPNELCKVIDSQLEIAQRVASDVDMNLFIFRRFGKGAAKKYRVSPDAFIQLALQLAYNRDQKKFCLTYESSMTRLFLKGRTETVRSCTADSVAFVRAMHDASVSRERKIELFRKACEYHQNLYRDAMTGKGVDRHLFTLYVVSRYLGIDSPFLKEVLSEPWRLSTSQSPYTQCDLKELKKVDPDSTLMGIGGGFGPVSDDGYGVAYMIIGENMIAFHISSKVSCPATSSKRFGEEIQRAMIDIDAMFSDA